MRAVVQPNYPPRGSMASCAANIHNYSDYQMKPEEFKRKVDMIRQKVPDFINGHGPRIAGTIAVSEFKRNFQTESFDGKKWPEVQRRKPGHPANKYAATHHPARLTRAILTGDTGDLGRSIEIKSVEQGQATIWTSPSAFGSKQPYGAVHNDGLKAGRGAGFKMSKRQFIGRTDALDDRITKELERQIGRLLK